MVRIAFPLRSPTLVPTRRRHARHCFLAFVVAAVSPQISSAQESGAELVLRPPDSSVVYIRHSHRDWIRAQNHEAIDLRDSIRVSSGGATILYTDGNHVFLQAGVTTTAENHDLPTRSNQSALGAAVEAILDIIRGNDKPNFTGRRPLEGSFSAALSAPAAYAHPRIVTPRTEDEGTATQMLLLPGELAVAVIAPSLSSYQMEDALKLRTRVFPASNAPGCPPMSSAILDTVVPNFTVVRNFAPHPQATAYRVEVGIAPIQMRCLRVASEYESMATLEALTQLDSEYRAVGPRDATLDLLQASLLTRGNFRNAALVRVLPIVRKDSSSDLVNLLLGELLVTQKLQIFR